MMQRLVALSIAFMALVAFAGCGKPTMVPVKIKVTHDGKPVGNCAVKLVQDVEPFDITKHGIGYGYTDANGECEIAHQMTAEKGLYPGSYKVTFEAWKNVKGKEVPPTAKPSEVEGGVIDRLPKIYKSLGTTTERLEVAAGTPIDREFALTGK